jgi:hypothetical protein
MSVEQSVEWLAGETKYLEKTWPNAALSTTNPHDLTWVRTLDAVVESQRLSAWATARSVVGRTAHGTRHRLRIITRDTIAKHPTQTRLRTFSSFYDHLKRQPASCMAWNKIKTVHYELSEVLKEATATATISAGRVDLHLQITCTSSWPVFTFMPSGGTLDNHVTSIKIADYPVNIRSKLFSNTSQ